MQSQETFKNKTGILFEMFYDDLYNDMWCVRMLDQCEIDFHFPTKTQAEEFKKIIKESY